MKGSWEEGTSAGGSRNNLEKFSTNPQYLLTLPEPGGLDRTYWSDQNYNDISNLNMFTTKLYEQYCMLLSEPAESRAIGSAD